MQMTDFENLDQTLLKIIRQQIELAGAKAPREIPDAARLVDIGLDSLGFATVMVEMKRSFLVDPFDRTDDILYPETLGELKSLYRAALETKSTS